MIQLELQNIRSLLVQAHHCWIEMSKGDSDIPTLMKEKFNPLLNAIEQSVKCILSCCQLIKNRKRPFQPESDQYKLCKKCKL